MDESEALVLRIVRELERRGIARALDRGSRAQTETWASWDLASMVEGCFHTEAHPADRAHWLERLGPSYTPPRFIDDDWLTRWLWITEGGTPVGTLALPVSAFGRRRLPLYSLYVRPELRRRGLASRSLATLQEVALAAGMGGIQLETHWPWQRSLRYYLSRRMWVIGWSSAIGLAWDVTWPRWELREKGEHIALVVPGRVRIEARRIGSELVLEDHTEGRDDLGLVRVGHATLAVLLATRGWPLVRSDEHWKDRLRYLELGEIEGLAERIARLERSYREQGWDVRTPAIGHRHCG